MNTAKGAKPYRPRSPGKSKLLQLPNGTGFTLVLTDTTIAGRQSAFISSQVAVSSNRTAQSNAVASALSPIPGAGGAAAALRNTLKKD